MHTINYESIAKRILELLAQNECSESDMKSIFTIVELSVRMNNLIVADECKRYFEDSI